MFEGHNQAIHDLLAERGLVDAVSLEAAFEECRLSGRSLAQTLIEWGLLRKPVLLQAVAEHLGCDYATDLPTTLPGDALALVAAGLARTHGVVPLSGDGFAISVAAVNPFNATLVTDLTFVLKREVRLSVADPGQVQLLIQRHYGGQEGAIDAAEGEAENGAREALTESAIAELAAKAPIVRFVNGVLAQAIRDKASDIHFEPFENEFKIRSRIDGALYEMSPPPRNLALPILSRLKVLANLNIAERRLPQDGRIKLNLGGRAVDLRVSTLPTQFGESAVLRVLDQSSVQLEIGQLGLPATIKAGVEEVIRRPNGIFIVTGPTGSGKTTTLYSCLKALNTVDAKLLTVEDPVEYEIDGVMQVPVNPGAGLTFARALRTFLRQDPDIVMVGEIRDLETARIAIQAALTGHLVLTTLHTNDAPSAMTRLVDMGIEPFLLASTVEAVLAQRLVRRVCQSCRVPYEPDEALRRHLAVEDTTIRGRAFHRASGCAACQHTGYKGRLGLFEFLPMTDALREPVVRGASLLDIRHKAVEQGLVSLRETGVEAVFAGETTVEEILRYT